MLSLSNQFHLEVLKGKTVVAAVSGGVDSMVLCALLLESGTPFTIGHVNYGLRGAESDGDEQLVRTYAEKHHLEIDVLQVDSSAESEAAGQSIQVYARELRYRWLEELRHKRKADYVITAHHKNDQAETILHQFVRGGGLAAMRGMKQLQGNIFRPLLHLSRVEIKAYAKANNINWREDSSNQKTDYTRNYIRHEVIPALERINPAVVNTITGQAALFSEMEEWMRQSFEGEIDAHTKRADDSIRFEVKWVAEHTAPNTLLWHLLSSYHFLPSQLQDAYALCKAGSGSRLLSTTHELLRDRESFILSPLDNSNSNVKIEILDAPFIIEAPIALQGEWVKPPSHFSDNRNEVIVDAGSLQWPLTLRTWQQGDTFRPLGMTGRQKVSDFLINQKISVSEKRKVFTLLSGNEIVWIVGHRIADAFKVTDRTSACLRLSCSL